MARHRYLPNGVLFDDDENDTDEYVSSGFRSRIPRPVPKEPRIDGITQQKNLYLKKKQEIEASILKSTERSINILLDTEDFGTKTARELADQGDKLCNMNAKLDEIDSHLIKSQRNINSIKSVFHGFKKIITGKSRLMSPERHTLPRRKNPKTKFYETDNLSPSTVKLVGVDSLSTSVQTENIPSSAIFPDNIVDEVLQVNLDTMSKHIANLKILGEEFGKEIDQQNELIDILQDKVEHADMKIGKQNKDMKKILG